MQQRVPVLDLDRVGHQVLREDAQVRQRLVDAFGSSMLDREGMVDRGRLAALAFGQAESLQRLNAIMHPAIRQREADWRARQRAPFVVIEASVLIESGQHARMDAVIVVLADLSLRRQRVLARGRQDASAFARIVERQCDDATRRRVADYLLYNQDSLDKLARAQRRLYRRLCERFVVASA